MFSKVYDFSKNEILVGGDFNAILNNDLDKLNESPYKNKLERPEILNYIKILNVIDAYHESQHNVKELQGFK